MGWKFLALLALVVTVVTPPNGVSALSIEEEMVKVFSEMPHEDLVQVFKNLDEETLAKLYLSQYDLELGRLRTKETVAAWNYNTNITDHNSNLSQEAGLNSTIYESEAYQIVSGFNQTGFSFDTKRQISKVGQKSLSEAKTKELSEVLAEMGKIYGSSEVCLPNKKCLQLSPGLNQIMENSTDYDLRLLVWKGWRTEAGQKLRPLYIRYVELKNELARLNGHDDLGDQWRDRFETDTFADDVDEMFEEFKPLYAQLHAYMRRKLFDVYGEEHIDLSGPLPAHILGDMWGRFWNNLYELAVPYPEKAPIVPTEAMKEQNYTAEKIFRTGDNFYAGMGMYRVPQSFWNLSMLTKPTDGRDVICHATAWDFYDGQDFRIKMCTRANNFQDLQTVHHELGHIQYQQAYKHQPQVYRDGANDGFHEAIGELMSLVSSTPSYLHKLGLLDSYTPDLKQDINFLLSQALITVSTIPFHLVNDKWRWDIFSGKVPVEKWNSHYWDLKEELVGVSAPVERSPQDLDGVTIFHVAQDFDMIRYFTRTVLQFQFLEALCKESGHKGPLHRCDFSGSKEAGAKLSEMLALGSKKPWPVALKKLTGTEKMSTKPILQFFEPLHTWLQEENKKNGDTPGWN